MVFYKAQIYCMFIIAIIFFMCWIGIKQRNRENRIFNTLLVVAFVYLIFDIASNYTVNHLDDVSPLVNRVIHLCFFIALSTVFLVAYKYLVALVEKELNRKLHWNRLSEIPYVVLCILMICLPIYYMEEETGNWSYGPSANLLYVCVGTYIILIIARIIQHWKDISNKNKIALVLAMVCEVGAALFQMFVPAALTSSLGVTLFCLCLYMTVANPDAVLVGLLREETARADAANQAKSDFLAKMSHEIRTPINAVLGMNEMILRQTDEPETKKYAKDIKSSANTLLSIINEILDSSKIEAGKMEIVQGEYEISSLLNDLYNMISVKAEDKGLKLVFDIESGIPTEYYGDDVRIKQVLVNLLTNAVKYTPQGTVTMTVTGRKEGDDEILKFSVKDTGIGIRQEDIEKLFSKFQRIDEKKNRYVEGTGLGMNITVQLLMLMGSELQVQSEYGKGSEFSFELVQQVINTELLGDFTQRVAQAATNYHYEIGYIAPEAKVLVVDDNEMNLKVFRSLLKQTRMQIYEAGSGAVCLEMVEREKYDLIFLDHMMPEMDGIETFTAMREAHLCEGTPVIMLTANAVVGARDKYLQAGFDDFLTKPIMPEKLDKIILQYLPEELVKEADYTKESKTDTKQVDMPELEEFDFEYAMRILNSEELLLQTLKDFYEMLGVLPEKFTDMMDTISQEETMTAYRIEVHALKSSAATVGALLLSKIARLLEVAAKEEDNDKILVLHPILLEEMGKHRERIATILPESEDKLPIESVDMIAAYLDMLKISLENDDFNTTDLVYGEVQKYQYSEEVQGLVDELGVKIMNLEAEEALNITEKIKELMGGTV